MRFQLVVFALLALPLRVAHATDTAPARKLQKVAIANLAWDTARAAQVEASIKESLVKKGVMADSLRTLTVGDKKPASVEELTALLQKQGYESLLCVGARKTMNITPMDGQNDFATLDTCLSIFLTGKYPSGVSLMSEPYVVGAQPTARSNAGGDAASLRGPIAGDAGAAPVTYYKRTIRLFDISQKTMFWEKKIMVKMPTELQDSMQASWIARETTKTLEQGGLMP